MVHHILFLSGGMGDCSAVSRRATRNRMEIVIAFFEIISLIITSVIKIAVAYAFIFGALVAVMIAALLIVLERFRK